MDPLGRRGAIARRTPARSRHPFIPYTFRRHLSVCFSRYHLTIRKNIATIKCMTCQPQLELDLRVPVGWGGARTGAGRKAAARPRVWHRERAEFPESFPGLVTIRVRRDVPSLRTVRLVREFECSLRAIAKRADFRVVQYSLQHDHVHLLVEAEGAAALSNGMKSLAARLARAVNRVFGRRGVVLDGRYHHHALSTPRGASGTCLCPPQCAKAHGPACSSCTERRFLVRPRVLGSMVRGLDRECGFSRRSPRGSPTPDLAAANRVAATRAHLPRRSTGWQETRSDHGSCWAEAGRLTRGRQLQRLVERRATSTPIRLG
jgi:REP element-mobilizing transposase RayT